MSPISDLRIFGKSFKCKKTSSDYAFCRSEFNNIIRLYMVDYNSDELDKKDIICITTVFDKEYIIMQMKEESSYRCMDSGNY